MNRGHHLLLALILAFAAAVPAASQIDYGMLVGTGTQMTGTFINLQSGSRAGAGQTYGYNQPSNNLVSIGFTFRFDGVNYTQAYVNSNGFVSFGGAYGNAGGNQLSKPGRPILAPFWDVMRISGGNNPCGNAGQVRYMTTGSSPNRIFVVEWKDLALGDGWSAWGYAPVTFQLRLYEGSNRIEFYYKSMDPRTPSCWTYWNTTMTTSASVGITSDNGYISVTPGGATATSSNSRTNDNINLSGSPISSNLLLTFCVAGIYGNTAQGGTAKMSDGDTLLTGREVPLSGVQNYQPFQLVSPCASTHTYTITGPAAADYSITPATGTLPAAGSTPTLTFSPKTLGVRSAKLTVRDNLGFVVRNYELAGIGIPRVSWIGNPSDGGTPNVMNGDTLMKSIRVYNGDVASFTPLSLRVAPGNGPPAPITYTLEDPTGQFTIDRTAENVPMGSTSSPVITFAPTGVGPQLARLTVNAEGEIRKYVLLPFAGGPGARFYIEQEELAAGSALFRNIWGCVGVDVSSVAIRIVSVGDEPFMLTSNDVYKVDNQIMQGRPNYPLERDPFGNVQPLSDYFISATSGSATPLDLPVTLQPGESRTVYLSFLPTRPAMRRARAFFASNALNYVGIDTENNPMQGVLNFELVGSGLGAQLSDPAKTGLPKPIVFPTTGVRESATATGMLYNAGECDLTISRDDLRIVSGDVSEFRITGPVYGVTTNSRGQYVVPPGDTALFDVEFTPVRSGSRSATVRIVTNDSLYYLPGVSERGVYYMDLYGKGKVGLEGRDVFIAPAVVDGPASTGTAVLENNSGGSVGITAIEILGSTEIIADPARPWPSIPRQVNPGDRIELGLLLQPEAGSAPGVRNATLRVSLDNGDVLILDLRGVAGTRLLSVLPGTLFQGVSVPVSQMRRQFLTISNDGTLPVRISSVEITGTSAADYAISPLSRYVIQPGGFEFIEVTWEPSVPGAPDAAIEIVTNSTNGAPAGTHTVTLGGTGSSTKFQGDPGTSTPAVRPGSSTLGAAALTGSGVALWQGTPNPTASDVTIRYATPEEQPIVIELYNSAGELVRTLLSERVDGEGTLRADLSRFPSGRYFYVLRAEDGVLTLALDLVK